MTALRQEDILAAVWRACDTFRGAVDATQYKDYILTILFLKYISDVRRKHVEEFRREFGGDELRIQRRLDRERFKLPTVERKGRLPQFFYIASALVFVGFAVNGSGVVGAVAATNSTGNTTAASTSAAPTPKPAVSTVKLSATSADLFKAPAQPRRSRPISDAVEMPAHAASTARGTVIRMPGGLKVDPRPTGLIMAFATRLEPVRLTTLSTSASRTVSPDRRERAPGKLVRDDMNTSSLVLKCR